LFPASSVLFVVALSVETGIIHSCPRIPEAIRDTHLTGYKQNVTGCGSQRKQCSFYSTKSNVNSMILILKYNLTSLWNIHIKSGHRWAPHTFLCIRFSTKWNSIWGCESRYLYEFSLSNNSMSSLRTTTCDALIVPRLSEDCVIKRLSFRYVLLPYLLWRDETCWSVALQNIVSANASTIALPHSFDTFILAIYSGYYCGRKTLKTKYETLVKLQTQSFTLPLPLFVSPSNVFFKFKSFFENLVYRSSIRLL